MTHRVKGLIGLLGLCLLLTLSWAAQVGLEGTHYPLRWGRAEGTGDWVKPYPPPVWGHPACFHKGSSLTLRLISEPGDPPIYCWKLIWAELRSKVTNTVYWRVGETDCMSPSQTIPLPNLPDFIEYAELRGEVALVVGLPWEPKVMEVDAAGQSGLVSEIFIVLDAPQAPMNPAWVSVLRISCVWAHGHSTAITAATALTVELHKQGNYNGGREAFTRYFSDRDTGEIFYLKEYLEYRTPYWGQCNDFADFLVCLNASVGGLALRSQRTHSVVLSRRVTTLPNGHPGLLLGFVTHPLDAARCGFSDFDGVVEWTYHQFAIDSTSRVWDGNIAFNPYSDCGVIWMRREPKYRDNLISRYKFQDLTNGSVVYENDPTFYWRPTPDQGFIPQITAESIP